MALNEFQKAFLKSRLPSLFPPDPQLPPGVSQFAQRWQAAQQAADEQRSGGLSDVPGAPPKGAVLGENTENRMAKEMHALTGFFAGLIKGPVEIGKDIERVAVRGEHPQILTKLPGILAKSLLATGKHIVLPNTFIEDVKKGTFTETLLNDIGNIAAVASLGAGVAGKVASVARAGAVDAAEAGDLARVAELTSRAQKAETAQKIAQTAAAPYRTIGKKLVVNPTVAASNRAAALAEAFASAQAPAAGVAAQLSGPARAAAKIGDFFKNRQQRAFAIEQQRNFLARQQQAATHEFALNWREGANALRNEHPDFTFDKASRVVGAEIKQRIEQLDPVLQHIKGIEERAGQTPALRTNELRALGPISPDVERYVQQAIDQFPDFAQKHPFLSDESKPAIVPDEKAVAAGERAANYDKGAELIQQEIDKRRGIYASNQAEIASLLGEHQSEMARLIGVPPDVTKAGEVLPVQEGKLLPTDVQARVKELQGHQATLEKDIGTYEDQLKSHQVKAGIERSTALRLEDESTLKQVDRQWRPHFNEFQRARQRWDKAFQDHAITPEVYKQMIDELPKNYGDFLDTMDKIGIHTPPPRIADFAENVARMYEAGRHKMGEQLPTTAQAKALEGREFKTVPGTRVTSPGEFAYGEEGKLLRNKYRGTGPVANVFGSVDTSHRLFLAMAGEKEWKDASNLIADKLDAEHMAIEVPKDGRVPDGYKVIHEDPETGVKRVVLNSTYRMLKKFATTDSPTNLALKGSVASIDVLRTGVLHFSPKWLFNNAFGNLFLAAVEEPTAVLDPLNWIKAIHSARAKKILADGTVVKVPFNGIDHRFMEGAGLGQDLRVSSDLINALPGAVRKPVSMVVNSSTKINAVTDQFMRALLYHKKLERVAKKISGETTIVGGKVVKGDLINADEILRKTSAGEALTNTEQRAVEVSVNHAIKAMVDYGNMSPFERVVMRRIIPFYTWQKNIAKLALSLPLDHPARFAALEYISNDLGGFSKEEREKFPEWLVPSIDIGGGQRLSTRGLNPFQDALSLFRPDGSGIAQSINPILSLPAQYALRKPRTPFGPEEIGPGGFSTPVIGPEKLLGNFFAQLPLLQAIDRLGTTPTLKVPGQSGVQTLLSYLGATIRNPQQVQKAMERLQSERRGALLSRLPARPPQPVTAPMPAEALNYYSGNPFATRLLSRRRKFNRLAALSQARPLIPLQSGQL